MAKVVILGLDRVGNYIKEAETPHIHQFLTEGILTYDAMANSPTISAECWGSLLHGVNPEVHQLNNDIVTINEYPEDSKYPSIFKMIKQKNPESKLVAFSAWKPIDDGIIEQSVQDVSVSLSDEQLTESIVKYIIENDDFNLIYVQYNC